MARQVHQERLAAHPLQNVRDLGCTVESEATKHPAKALAWTYRPNAGGEIERVPNDCCCALRLVGVKVSACERGQVKRLIA